MHILFYSPDNRPQPWLDDLAQALPDARLSVWREGEECGPADYIVAWQPPAALLHGRTGLKALFNLGAGVDAILQLGDALPPEVTIVRLDGDNLAKLQPGAYLINVARGAHVAEPDLLAAIKSGQIAGATLDVCRTEPLPPQHPFWQEPRITLTPHIAAMTLREESIRQIA